MDNHIFGRGYVELHLYHCLPVCHRIRMRRETKETMILSGCPSVCQLDTLPSRETCFRSSTAIKMTRIRRAPSIILYTMQCLYHTFISKIRSHTWYRGVSRTFYGVSGENSNTCKHMTI